jgi:phage tail-like protein
MEGKARVARARRPFRAVTRQLAAGQAPGGELGDDQRFDPYKNFKFKIKWDGRYVAGASKVSALKRGNSSTARKSPGRTRFDAVTIERGITHDAEFEAWANKVWSFASGPGAETSLKDLRKDVIIELNDATGRVAKAFRLLRCWVSEFQALADLDAEANAVAIASMKIEHEGWEGDPGLKRPGEASPT